MNNYIVANPCFECSMEPEVKVNIRGKYETDAEGFTRLVCPKCGWRSSPCKINNMMDDKSRINSDWNYHQSKSHIEYLRRNGDRALANELENAL